jgi:PAS domain-containing protein/HPt (histidine-containing phosphotransfer) domain-containing protein
MPSWKFWLWIFAVCVTTQALGAIVPNLNDRDSLRLAYQDNPGQLRIWSAEQLKHLDPDKEPVLWIRALWANAMSVPKWSDIPDARNLFFKASRIAEAHGLTYEMIHFLDYATDVDNQSNDPRLHHTPEEMKQHYQSLIHRAEQADDQVTAFKMALNFANYLAAVGETGASFAVIRRYSENISKYPDLKTIDLAFLKQTLGENFLQQDEKSKAYQVLLELDDFCQNLMLRSFCGHNLVQLGSIEVENPDPAFQEQARIHFEKAFQLGREADHLWLVSFAQGSLLEMDLKDGRYAKALDRAEESIQDRKRIDDRDTLADGYVLRARAKAGLNDVKGALQDLDLATQTISLGANLILSEIERLRSQYLKKIGDAAGALAALEHHLTLYQATVRDKEQTEFSKQRASIGLLAEEERSKLLVKENELKQQKIKEQEKTRYFTLSLLILCAAVIAVLSFAVVRSREIKRTRTAMKRILDHIEEAIITIDRNLTIDAYDSAYLSQILGDVSGIKNKDAIEVLFQGTDWSREQHSIIREALHASIGEDPLAWELNMGHLPDEFMIHRSGQTRTIDMRWQPIPDRTGRIQSVLLILRDVTARKHLESEVAIMRDHNLQLTRKMGELITTRGQAVSPLFERVRQLTLDMEKAEGRDNPRLLRELHSIKGIARSIGLASLSEATHDVESYIHLHPIAELLESGLWQHWKLMMLDYEDLLEKFSFHAAAKTSPQSYGRSTLSLHVIAAELQPALIQNLKRANLKFGGFFIHDDWDGWHPDFFNAVKEIGIHAFNNSIDHGFIIPQKKGRIPEAVEIRLEATTQGDELILAIIDNGCGLDWNQIRRLALQRGVPAATQKDLIDFLFMDQVSTASEVSLTSGRGLGLAAIRSLSQEWGGICLIENRPDRHGACLTLRFPRNRVAGHPLHARIA